MQALGSKVPDSEGEIKLGDHAVESGCSGTPSGKVDAGMSQATHMMDGHMMESFTNALVYTL